MITKFRVIAIAIAKSVNSLLESYSNFCLVINLQFDFVHVDEDRNQVADTKFLIKTILQNLIKMMQLILKLTNKLH